MAQDRLTVRKIHEILRLKEEAGLSNHTMGEYHRRWRVAPGDLALIWLYLFPGATRIESFSVAAGHVPRFST
jgi:hypothetical protein